MLITATNFREINYGKISPKLLYRSSHPIFNGKQVKGITLAANSAKIQTVINLSDNIRSLKHRVMCCPWYREVFEKNNVIALNIDRNFTIMDGKFTKKLREGLIFMTEHEPPYLIHCEAGVDRTGFFSLILESFMGAPFDDMVKDYMLSFVNSSKYALNDHKNGSRFMIDMFSKIKGETINTNEDLQCLSTKYLMETIKLSSNELHILGGTLMNRPSSRGDRFPGVPAP
jgi:hypothetical protein